MTVQVILLEDVHGLGERGTVKEVKEGYARNYLFPRGLALEATAGNLQAHQRHQQATEQRAQRTQEEMRAVVTSLAQAVVELRAKGGEGGRLFGSVTADDIAQALAARGFAITKKQIELTEPIKTAGFYTVPVRVGPGVVARVDLNVIATP
jgi:large subunit ribosomal protein L9